MTPTIAVDQPRLSTELDTLARISDAEFPAVTRVLFTKPDRDARKWLGGLLEEAGLTVRVDPVGNIFARWPGTEPDLPAVGTGSHTDAIPFSGMYDGTVGVLGGLEAVRSLKRAGFRPRRSIELLMFTAEEPTRFGIGCVGSRLLAGTLAPAKAGCLRDKEGRSLDEIRRAAGCGGELADVEAQVKSTMPRSSSCTSSRARSSRRRACRSERSPRSRPRRHCASGSKGRGATPARC